MTIEENVKIVNQIKVMREILQRLVDQTGAATISIYGIDFSDGGVHLRRGIDHLACAMGQGLIVDERDSEYFPYDAYFIDTDGLRYYQIMDENEYKNLVENCAVELYERG